MLVPPLQLSPSLAAVGRKCCCWKWELCVVVAVTRWLGVALVVLTALGCGKKGHSPWPAAVVSLEGFDESQHDTLTKTLEELNVRVARTVVAQTVSENAYPITIRMVDGWKEAPSRAGYATVSADGCVIELSGVVFTEARTDYVRPVVWHELGHCAGLTHTTSSGEVMSAASAPLPSYSTEALDRFYRAFLASAGL